MQTDKTCNVQLGVTMEQAIRTVTRHQDRGERIGIFLDESFEHISATFFDGKLPQTLILWELSAWGRCIGKTEIQRDDFPRLLIHPWTLSNGKSGGWRQVYCTLLHELMHVRIEYLLGGWKGKVAGTSSHNNQLWCDEVNRIAPLLGLRDINAGIQIVKREGKKVKRVETGNIPLKEFSRFPHDELTVSEPLRRFYQKSVVAWLRESDGGGDYTDRRTRLTPEVLRAQRIKRGW